MIASTKAQDQNCSSWALSSVREPDTVMDLIIAAPRSTLVVTQTVTAGSGRVDGYPVGIVLRRLQVRALLGPLHVGEADLGQPDAADLDSRRSPAG